MNYFSNLNNIEELKKVYFSFAKKLHPDLGGTNEEMKALNEQYDRAVTELGGNKSEAVYSVDLRPFIDKLIIIEGINIELCGSWLWISGNTYPVRKELSIAGAIYHSKKKMWYVKGAESASKKNTSMNDIRNYYGSKMVKTAPALT